MASLSYVNKKLLFSCHKVFKKIHFFSYLFMRGAVQVWQFLESYRIGVYKMQFLSVFWFDSGNLPENVSHCSCFLFLFCLSLHMGSFSWLYSSMSCRLCKTMLKRHNEDFARGVYEYTMWIENSTLSFCCSDCLNDSREAFIHQQVQQTVDEIIRNFKIKVSRVLWVDKKITNMGTKLQETHAVTSGHESEGGRASKKKRSLKIMQKRLSRYYTRTNIIVILAGSTCESPRVGLTLTSRMRTWTIALVWVRRTTSCWNLITWLWGVCYGKTILPRMRWFSRIS